jgi:adenine-specific DNA-methyltransferase
MGSGTVAVVAKNYERHFMGAEIELKYHQVALRRLSNKPDNNSFFPNLKALRDYVEKTGEPIDKFRFDVQVGQRASERSQAKIYSEEYHLIEMEERLLYEEAAFAATLREEELPVDSKLNGNGKKTKLVSHPGEQIQLNLWS